MHVFPTHLGMILAGLILAPVLPGIINRTKAVCAGRHGPPFLQLYYDIFKLLRKNAVYSRTTTWVFRANPPISLAAVIAVLALIPMAQIKAPVSFMGDFILLAYALGLTRFLTILAALDTGSSFEGMGASREAQFSALAEPPLILGLGALAYATGQFSISAIFGTLYAAPFVGLPEIILIVAAWLIVFLTENSRIPVDDPATHLELTMIHEAMILDYAGPDLAMILYTSALKIWLLGALVVNVALGFADLQGGVAIAAFAVGMALLAVVVGLIESSMARLNMVKVPRLLGVALVLSVLALALIARTAL
ncbi:MAG: respiratory chain complex I subunit 1 family protein [Kiritimatiellia bacterium]|jgi:formate hydrogenlyase subunit 4